MLPEGAPHALNQAAGHIDNLSLWSAFLSAIVGGALITGNDLDGGGRRHRGRADRRRLDRRFAARARSLNHVIVVTLELIFGMRYGADIALGEVVANFGIAVAGNMIGGIVFVTLTRTSQAIGSGETDSPTK